MNQNLLAEDQQPLCSRVFSSIFTILKISALVILTYGLMVVVFIVCLRIEEVKGSIPASYMAGGAIIFAMFIAYLIFWGVLWCWGARQRDDLRRTVVERQLQIIRKEEYDQEQRDLEEQRRMIQEKRMRKGY